MLGKKEKVKIHIISERKVTKKGKYDGRSRRWNFGWPLRVEKDPVPSDDNQDPAPFERRLITAADENLNRLQQTWVEMDEKSYKDCELASEKFKGATDRCTNAKTTMEKYKVSEDQALTSYGAAKKQFDEYPKPHLSFSVGIILLAIITVAEGFFNLQVFNIFAQSRLETILMAIGVVFTIPVSGWFIGKNLKLRTKTRTCIVMMIITSLIVVSGFAIIAFLRKVFLEAMNIQAAIGIAIDPSIMGLSLFFLNLLLFFAILAIEYESAHEDYDGYTKIKTLLKNEETKLEKARRVAIEAIKKFEDTRREVETSREELKSAMASRAFKVEKIKAVATEERSRWFGLIHVYRDANISVRPKGGPKPKILTSEIDKTIITIPEFKYLQSEGNQYAELFAEKAE